MTVSYLMLINSNRQDYRSPLSMAAVHYQCPDPHPLTPRLDHPIHPSIHLSNSLTPSGCQPPSNLLSNHLATPMVCRRRFTRQRRWSPRAQLLHNATEQCSSKALARCFKLLKRTSSELCFGLI